MDAKKKQLLRDVILVSSLLLIVLVVFIIYYSVKTVGDLAVVAYDNETLFEVDMESGVSTVLTDVYKTNEMPLIKGDDLLVEGEKFESLKKGEGVLIYKSESDFKDYYFIKGNLGYVKIYFNKKTKKMKVLEETSPYNTCSKQGESNDVPLVCLPNYVTIKFTKNIVDDII